MVIATERAANRKAIIAGKPEPLIMDCIIKKLVCYVELTLK